MKKLLTAFLVLLTVSGYTQSTTIVISQAYGGGGGSTGSYIYDYVELHNVSNVTQSLTGHSLQYGSATGQFGASTSNIYAFPAGTTIPAGGYLLIQLGPAGSGGAAFPVTPDLITGNLTMSSSSGKVVLSNQAASLGCGATATPCTLPNSMIVDLVAYGVANNGEGGTTVNNGVALTSSQGSVRKNNGCQDTDNNNNDFVVQTAPIPRNSATAPFLCGGAPPPPPASITAGTVSDFGNVIAGTSSPSQTFDISGSNLTGAPGNITITSPSADFQVSSNNTTWGSTALIPYTTSTLPSTPVYVRFTPQSAGMKSGNVTVSGGGATSTLNVPVSGNGLPPVAPTLGATTLPGFGTVCVNTTAGPNTFTINGTNLIPGNINIGPAIGYTFATTTGGAYSNSLSINQPGGSFTQTVFVRFTPTGSSSFNTNIPVTGGGGNAINVQATGTGANSPATVTTGNATGVATASATLPGTIVSSGCSTVTSYGFEYSTVNGFGPGTGTTVNSNNLSSSVFSAVISGLAPSTTYYFKAFAVNSGGTGYGAQQQFNTLAPPPPVLTGSGLAAFGGLCLNTTGGPNSFTVSGNNLTNTPVVINALNGFTFATSANGTYTNSLSITQPGGTFSQTIFVRFTPTALQNYSGNIVVSGGGNAGINIPVSASGINTLPTVSTGGVSSVSPNSAVVSGTMTATGCTVPSETGIVYSGIQGFAGNHGIKVPSAVVAGSWMVTIPNLIPSTRYYYRAYATNAAGTTYGNELSFTTGDLKEGLVIYSSPLRSGRELHYSWRNITPGHYQVRLYNWQGQVVFQKDLITQVNFIDDRFIIPGTITKGVYTFQIGKEDVRVNKTILIL